MNRAATLVSLATLVLGPGSVSHAGPDINEVAEVLVYPTVLNEATASGPTLQTFATVTNAGSVTTGVRFFFVDGTGCGWCVTPPLSLLANDSETFRISRNFATGNTEITALDAGLLTLCPGANGFAVAVLVDPSTGEVQGDNVLVGSSIVRDGASGTSFSMAAIGFQGAAGGNGDFNLQFDDVEYYRFPALVIDTVLAPDLTDGIDATLSLFTLNFNRGTPPWTRCSITATDETGWLISATYSFGCWTHVDLESINPRFHYPDWGSSGGSEEISLIIDCEVDVDSDGNFDADGAVHGAVSQRVAAGARVRRSDPASPVLGNEATWGRLLAQSVTAGDATRLSFEICNGIDDDLDSIVDEGCDADGDGYCVAALGFTGEPAQCAFGVGDCDPGDGSTYPGAPEVNDGLDNQCPGDLGFGALDEITGTFTFTNPDNTETLCWPPQQGATEYEAVRSFDPLFPAGTCAIVTTSGTCVVDTLPPGTGQVLYYLVHAIAPNEGSYGLDSDGVERTGICE